MNLSKPRTCLGYYDSPQSQMKDLFLHCDVILLKMKYINFHFSWTQCKLSLNFITVAWHKRVVLPDDHGCGANGADA